MLKTKKSINIFTALLTLASLAVIAWLHYRYDYTALAVMLLPIVGHWILNKRRGSEQGSKKF